MIELSKKKSIFLIVLIVLILISFATLTYAYFGAPGMLGNVSDANVVTLTGELGVIRVTYLEGNAINNPGIILNEDEGDYNILLKFSIENEGTVPQDVLIHFEELTNGFCQYQRDGVCTNNSEDEDVRNELNYTLYECPTNTEYLGAEIGDISGCTAISDLNTTMPETGSREKIHAGDRMTIGAETTTYYVFELTIENKDILQNYNQNKLFSGKIMVDYPYTLAKAIQAKYTAVSDENIDFSYTSNGCNDAETCVAGTIVNDAQVTNGLYINNANGEDGSIKYFRGDVNNYVEFGTYAVDSYHTISGSKQKEQYTTLADCETQYPEDDCALYHSAGDPILWRVIRIDQTNRVRLITEDTIMPKTKYNEYIDDSKYVGYTYDDSNVFTNDGTNSTIKTTLEDWYEDNLSSYASYINQTTEYCNDTSGSIEEFSTYTRLRTNYAPTYSCPNTNQTYGGLYELPIGIITADEVAYAGGLFYVNNQTFYLRNQTYFWTASPYYFSSGARECYVGSSGYIDRCEPNDSENGIRAVIELNNNNLVVGQGTSENPWVIQ